MFFGRQFFCTYVYDTCMYKKEFHVSHYIVKIFERKEWNTIE